MPASGVPAASEAMPPPIGTKGSIDDIELLWRLYADNRTQAQFHESQRATATAVVAGGAGALVAAVFATEGATRADLPLAAMILMLGVIGYIIARKGTEKLRLHNKRCRKFLEIINAADPTLDVVAIKSEVDDAHVAQNWLISKIKLSTLWHGLHLIIIGSGVALLWFIFCQP